MRFCIPQQNWREAGNIALAACKPTEAAFRQKVDAIDMAHVPNIHLRCFFSPGPPRMSRGDKRIDDGA